MKIRQLQNHKGKKKKKEQGGRKEKKRKSNGCTLGFYNGYFGDSFWPKKKNCRTQKGPFGGKVLKNPVQSDPRLMQLKKPKEWPRLEKPFN